MVKRVAVSLLLAAVTATAVAQAPPQHWVKGKNYIAVPDPQPTRLSGKVVVTEVFSFACPVCDRFQPFIDKLEDELPKGVVMNFVPAAFRPDEDWPVFQRAYFTAKALGVDNQKSHDAMFHAVWGPEGSLATYDMTTQRPKDMADMPRIGDIAKLYAKFGAKPGEFVAAAHSFSVNLDMKRADQQIIAWGISGTPTIVVDGKWSADMGTANGAQQLVDLTLYLVHKELAAKQAR